MTLVGLIVNLEAVGARITYDNGTVTVRGKNIPKEFIELAKANRDLLRRYYRIRQKALELQEAIDPEDESKLLPMEEREKLLESFLRFVEEAEKLEVLPLPQSLCMR